MALVISIIVMIILTGISINMLLGENGIIQRTKTAKQETLIAQYKEKIELVRAETRIENEGNITLDKLNSAFNKKSQKEWINKTEIENGIIKLTTNDGYLFFVNENTIQYKGMGNIIVPEVITAEMLEFTPTDLSWTGITNVKQALDYLYNN